MHELGWSAPPPGEAVVRSARGEAVVDAADALSAAAARAGDVDVASIAAAAEDGSDAGAVGEAWIIELGAGPCPAPHVESPETTPGVGVLPQAHVHEGAAGSASSSGVGLIVDWTTKLTTGGHYDHGASFVGVSDFWCAQFVGVYVWWPMVDGAVRANPAP